MRICKTVGIDLGATCSAIALLDATDTAIVTGVDDEGAALFPSAVALDSRTRQPVAGRAALACLEAPGALTLLELCRSTEPDRELALGRLSLSLPEFIALIFRGLREQLDRALNDSSYRPDRGVVAVPACFNDVLIAATRHAGELAGFEVAEVLPAPAAAATYHARVGHHGDATYLVYDLDLAGRSFNASVVRRRQGAAEILAASGNPFFGDTDVGQASGEHPASDSARSPYLGTDPPSEFDRAFKERLASTLTLCREALSAPSKDVGLSDVDYVVLVGSGSQSPAVCRFVRAAFCDVNLPGHARCPEPLSLEPQFCVAYGAALRGAELGTRYLLPARGGEMQLHLTSAPNTRDALYELTGTIGFVASGGAPAPHADGEAQLGGFSVRVRPLAAGLVEEAFVDERGNFSLVAELEAESDNALELTVCDDAGVELARAVTTVRHRSLPCVPEAQPRPARAGEPSRPAGPESPGALGPLDPPWPEFSRLVRRCLDLAAEVADRTGREREELFEHVWTQERYAESAYAAANGALYRECRENLDQFAAYLDSLLRDALPRPVARPTLVPEDEARDLLERFRTYLAAVWKNARAKGRAELEARLRSVAGQAAGLSGRLKADARGVLREVRRLGSDVARVEEELAGGIPGRGPGGSLEDTP